MQDTEFLRRLKKSDTEALNQIITKYSPYVCTVLSHQLGGFGSAEDVEELASSVFYSLWRHRWMLRTDHLQGWLAAVARNEARALLRKRKIDTVPLEDQLILDGEDAEDLLEAKERRKYLQAALDEMEPDTREIFIRHFYYNQTLAVIAGEMQMNPATVKSRLQRGKRKLREKLEEGGDFFGN